LGVFTVQFAVGAPPQSRVIKKDGSELWLRDLADGEPTCFRYGFAYHEAVILIAENGAWACVQLLEKDAQHFSSGLMPPEDLKAGDDAPFWAVVLRDANGVSPVRITIFEDHATLDEHERIPLQNARKLHVAPLGDGFCSVTIDFDETSAKMAVKLIAPEAVAYKIWQEWDVRRTRTGIADAAAADLYKQFNEAKKYNLLSALFADVVLLNRELNSKISMDDLMAELESKGPVEFSEDKRLRELTISKMVLLISVLPRIKQKFELLAAMYPYYWAQQEASWLEMIFGKARVAGVVTAQTRRIVPVVRREVRSMQANVQRALGEIEASLRPLDALFAREEVQKSGWSKIRRWAPVAGKAAAVGAMPFVPHVAIPYLIMQAGGFFAGDVLGNVCGIFLKDSETHSQFQRAAKSVFPWWQIFMRTLVISIYEAAQFIDDENIRAMKRDKQLFDQVPATEKPATLQTLSTELRKRIIQERRNYFAEISAGSGLRLSNVIDDIQASIGKEVNQFVAEFTQGVTLSNKTKNRDMP